MFPIPQAEAMTPSEITASTSLAQKRSAHEMDVSSSDEEKPDISSPYSPSPSPPARSKGKAKAANGSRIPKKAKTAQANGQWSSEARSTIVKYIFDRATEGLNYGELSAIVRPLSRD